MEVIFQHTGKLERIVRYPTFGDFEAHFDNLSRPVPIFTDHVRNYLENKRGRELEITTWKENGWIGLPIFRTYHERVVIDTKVAESRPVGWGAYVRARDEYHARDH